MSMTIATFKRIEKKYRLDTFQMADLSVAIAPYVEIDQYGLSRIDSLYYDTPDRSMIARSLEKPLYKEKLRIRAYGDFDEASEVFVELKKKYEGVVYKRRVRMSRLGAQVYLSGSCSYEEAMAAYPVAPCDDDAAIGRHARIVSEPTALDLQIAREIDALIARNSGLKPSVLITCTRTAYRSKLFVNDDLRLTFDEQIGYRDLFSNKPYALGEGFTPLTGSGEFLMEVKAPGSVPMWFAKALAKSCAYPSSFSKYGSAYSDIISKTQGRHCA